MYCVSYGVNLAKISVYFVDNWLGTWADRKFLSDDRIFSHRPHLNRSCQIFNSDLLWKPKNFCFVNLSEFFCHMLNRTKRYREDIEKPIFGLSVLNRTFFWPRVFVVKFRETRFFFGIFIDPCEVYSRSDSIFFIPNLIDRHFDSKSLDQVLTKYRVSAGFRLEDLNEEETPQSFVNSARS